MKKYFWRRTLWRFLPRVSVRDTKNLDYRFVEIFQGINLISTARNELAWLHKHVDTWSRSGSNRYRKFDRALSRVRSPGSLSIIQRPWLPYNPRILHLPVSIRIALCPCASIHACDSNSRCFICHPGPTPILTMTDEAWIELLEARLFILWGLISSEEIWELEQVVWSSVWKIEVPIAGIVQRRCICFYWICEWQQSTWNLSEFLRNLNSKILIKIDIFRLLHTVCRSDLLETFFIVSSN